MRRVRLVHRALRTLFVLLAVLALVGCSDDGGDGGERHWSADDVQGGDTRGGGGAQDTWGGGSGDTTTGADTGGWGSADTSSPEDWWGGGGDTASPDASSGGDTTGGGNTNVSLGGAQDFGYVRRLLDDGIVPTPEVMEAAGFFAEHHTPLPAPVCGERICVQAMLGVMGNLINGSNCTLLQLGLNSPIEADPGQRPPLSLTVVVDVSGSMATGGKIDFVRQGLQRMVNELQDTDQLAIVLYESDASLAFPMQPVSGQRNVLTDLIAGLAAGGGTNLYAGLELGYGQSFLHYDSGRQNRVLLLSDGNASSGITDPVQILDMSRTFNADGVGLTTIGLGTDFDYTLMRDLALQADGNFYFVEDSSAVDEVFSEELSYFTVPVGYDVRLELLVGEDYTLGEAHGSPLWEETADGGRVEVPSVFLAHRVSHDDVTPDGGRRGGGSALLVELMPRPDDGTAPASAKVATVELEFREPGTDRIITEQLVIEYPHAPWTLPTSGHFDNAIVEKSFVMLNIYVALESAVLLFHGGQGEAAVGLLERVIAAAADYEDSANDGMGDVDIQYDLALLQQLRDVMLANGAIPPAEPDVLEDPWPAD